jgi:hypothetical protein
LITANLPPYTPAGGISAGTITAPTFSAPTSTALNQPGGGGTNMPDTGYNCITINSSNFSISGGYFTGSAQGGTSTAFSIVQPTLVLNKIVKVH